MAWKRDRHLIFCGALWLALSWPAAAIVELTDRPIQPATPSLKRLEELLGPPPTTHREAVWPVAGQSRISSYFGVRRHPIDGVRRAHQGLDIAAISGTPIVSIGPGTVVFAGWRSGYGRTIDIEHADGWTTRYAHAKRITVKKGQLVLPGQMIGHVGRSGHATGAHLHFELWRQGEVFDPLTLWKSPTPGPHR